MVRRCFVKKKFELFHDGGRYHIETSPLIGRANQWTGFYIITASVLKEFKTVFVKLTRKNLYRGLLQFSDFTVCTPPLSAKWEGGRWGEPFTQFSKGGAWQDLKF